MGLPTPCRATNACVCHPRPDRRRLLSLFAVLTAVGLNGAAHTRAHQAFSSTLALRHPQASVTCALVELNGGTTMLRRM